MNSQILIDDVLIAKLDSCSQTQMIANSSQICCVLILDYYTQISDNLLVINADSDLLKALAEILPFPKYLEFDNVFHVGTYQSRRLNIFPVLKEYLSKVDV